MSRKLYDRLKSEKFSSSYADRHFEMRRNEEDSALKSYGNHHKQGNCGRSNEEDEMVKYMSNLPCYLQKGKTNCEKVLNVGVLDWARLEQWQYYHKNISHKSGRTSTSSNASSSISTDGLSGHPSRGHSCCQPSRGHPSRGQRIFHPSLQSHFMASPIQGHSQAVKSSRESVANCQNFRSCHSNVDPQSKYDRADDHLSLNHPKSRLKGCDRKYLVPYVHKERGIFPNDQMHEAESCAKLENCTKKGGSGKTVETLEELNIDVVQGTPRKSEPVLLPRHHPQNSRCGVPRTQTSLVQTAGNYSRLNFSEEPKELFHRGIHYDIAHSSSLPDELHHDHSQHKESGCSSIDLESIKLSTSTFSSPISTFSSPLSIKMGGSPSRSKKAEERKQTIAKTSSANGPLHGLDQKVTSEKSRSYSPFRRLSFSGSYTSKGSASKEGEHVPHLNSISALKSNSENVRGYASSNLSGNDKPSDAGRSRSSSLRRLLDPLLKPKTAKSRHSLESSQKDSVSINKNYRSANGNLSTLQPNKEMERDHRVGCRSVNTTNSSKDEMCIPSMTQALLRIVVRNGMPLFTFVVDHTDKNILAATVKNLGASGKDECNYIYTFFTFNEVKKSGSWMNQTGRSRSKVPPDYFPHVVAQMKVSDSYYYDLTSQSCMDSSTMKEFVMFSVKLGQDQANDYQPNDELAAIVFKKPKATGFIDDHHQSSYQCDGQDIVHATVVLPSGVHSLPSKGGPSSLIERWKSGGSCDCGGWDLACKLKILANENQASKKPKSSGACVADQLDLFVQGNEQELPPPFSFNRIRHGIYSIAFDSSLSLLQAFSISIALANSKMPYELSG
ncbi:hypothetical protein VNO77_36307 [Canavalia gladiata]|uniref:Uncharacterized protein n=1 Tax=Canavalia gladiata TaxID=3824 RepID=A0AAN9KAZ4_CANGL